MSWVDSFAAWKSPLLLKKKKTKINVGYKYTIGSLLNWSPNRMHLSLWHHYMLTTTLLLRLQEFWSHCMAKVVVKKLNGYCAVSWGRNMIGIIAKFELQNFLRKQSTGNSFASQKLQCYLQSSTNLEILHNQTRIYQLPWKEKPFFSLASTNDSSTITVK